MASSDHPDELARMIDPVVKKGDSGESPKSEGIHTGENSKLGYTRATKVKSSTVRGKMEKGFPGSLLGLRDEEHRCALDHKTSRLGW